MGGLGASTAMQGTIFWMAPEVIDTSHNGYDKKIDIWSVGCVVLEMWAGKRPWSGDEAFTVILKVSYHLPVTFSFIQDFCRCSFTRTNFHLQSPTMLISQNWPSTSGANASPCAC